MQKTTLKIALIGYGNIGQIIEKLALDQGHLVVARITSHSWDLQAIQKADICMEFTQPESVVENVTRIAQLNKSVIIGTTGWHKHFEQIRSVVEKYQIGALYSSNFSIGVNLLFNIVSHAARLIDPFEEYDVSGYEVHHRKKKDSPSGTAKEIARVINNEMKRMTVAFSSVRSGSNPGTHTILFDSPCDTISISHEARNREGFAKGALFAAQWLIGRKGLYTFSDCLKDSI